MSSSFSQSSYLSSLLQHNAAMSHFPLPSSASSHHHHHHLPHHHPHAYDDHASSSSPYPYDGPPASSYLSKYLSSHPSSSDITTASIIPLSPSSLSSAALRLKSGSSCHQCKTNKDAPHLYFCTSKTETAVGKRNCRKKYCVACMGRWYKALCGPAGGAAGGAGGGWICPSCCGQCVCAACDRKKERANRKAQEEGAGAKAGDASNASATARSGSDDDDPCERLSLSGHALKGEDGRPPVAIGLKRERSAMSLSDGEDAADAAPFSKAVKMEVSPSFSSTAPPSTEHKERNPSMLVLPRAPANHMRLQSDPGMASYPQGPASTSPRPAMVAPLGHPAAAQAIVAPLPPRATSGNGSSRTSMPPPFHLPSHTSSASYLEGMQEAAVRVITRYFNSSIQAQQERARQQSFDAAHGRHGSEEVPALTSFSSSSSSQVSTPTTASPPQHFLPTASPSDAFGSAAAPRPTGKGALPSAPQPFASTARSTTVPVTSQETDRNIAVRAMTHIGHLPFDPSTPSLSLLGSPLISPVPSLPTSPRHLSSLAQRTAPLSSSHLSDDVFNPSPLFNTGLSLGGLGMGGMGEAGADYPERGTPVSQFWFKSGVNSLTTTPRHAPGSAAAGGMGEVEFQALFN